MCKNNGKTKKWLSVTQIEGKGVWPLNILYEQKFLRQLWLRRFVRKLETQSRLFAPSWKPKKKKQQILNLIIFLMHRKWAEI